MADRDDNLRRSENQSMRKSRVGDRYFRIDPGYNKQVYENTLGNWARIIGSFVIFYIAVFLFWLAVFFHGIQDVDSATILYIIILVFSFTIIGILIIIGHFSTKKLQMINKITLEMDEEIARRRAEEIKQKKKQDAEENRKRAELKAHDYPSEEDDD